ncbi:sulfotransferase family 2 domain-containing protein [Thiohalorhabdus methylotrophus]|uniref:Sulfotransferase family 2 domain-containing protein n=1 Tax=Thiohalorhabdus methylotrophus TaxID=3242694 RepID=A0ABV4TVI9_9GAMM
MIICHTHRFIFIKTRKTAGSSVEIALSRVCGEGDVVTPLSASRGEEELRRREGGYGPANHLKPVLEHRGFKEWRRLLGRRQRTSFGEHMTAPEIRKLVGQRIWSRYFKFTIERNPWDRALSRYWWQRKRWEEKGRTGFPSLSEYLIWLERNKPHWLSNWGHYTIDGEIAVDRVLFYENLSEGLAALGRELGLGDKLQLPKQRAKSGYRKDQREYDQVLSLSDQAHIERVCHREIEAFAYGFLPEESRAVSHGHPALGGE